MKNLLIGLIVIIAGVYFLGSCFGDKTQVDKMTLMSGYNVKITKDCFGAVSKDAYDKLVSYTSSQNVPAADRMRQSGQLLVMKAGDVAELIETSTGYVKMKMLSGLYAGREVYVFREMVVKISSQEASNLSSASQPSTVKTNTESNMPPVINPATAKADINDARRAIYNEWFKQYNSQVNKFKELDPKIFDYVQLFRTQKLTTTFKNEMQALLTRIERVQSDLMKIKSPNGITPAIDANISQLQMDFKFGVNDRMVVLNRLIDYIDKKYSYSEVDNEILSALQSSGKYLLYSEARFETVKSVFN